jgi:hypothetical protein
VSSLLLIVAILLGIILRSSLGNRLDKSILLVLLGEEKLLLTEFVITVEIVASSEVEIIQLGFELFKARIPYNLDFAYGRKHGSLFGCSRRHFCRHLYWVLRLSFRVGL